MPERKKRTVGLLLTTANQDIYTVPPRFTADITSVTINNYSASDATFTLDFYDSATATFKTLAGVVDVTANSLLQIKDYPLYLLSGDKLRGLASANTSINITVSIEEYYETSL